jgi:hypothetical protein
VDKPTEKTNCRPHTSHGTAGTGALFAHNSREGTCSEGNYVELLLRRSVDHRSESLRRGVSQMTIAIVGDSRWLQKDADRVDTETGNKLSIDYGDTDSMMVL